MPSGNIDEILIENASGHEMKIFNFYTSVQSLSVFGHTYIFKFLDIYTVFYNGLKQ